MTVLLDLNVILDVLLAREPWRSEGEAIWDANRDGRLGAFIPVLTAAELLVRLPKDSDA